MGRGLEVVKRSGRDESLWVVIHICMETTQGISLYCYPYLKLAKTPCFSYYLLCFFLQQNQRTRVQNRFYPEVGEEGLGPNNVYTCK
jgi:hypothetical protein